MESSDLLPPAPTLEDAGGDETTLGHLQKLHEAIEKYFTLFAADDWKLETDKSGVQLYSKKSGESIDYVKRTMEVKVSKEDLISFFLNLDKIKAADKKLVAMDLVEEIDDRTKLIRIEMKGNMIVSNRDFTIIRKRFELSDGSLFVIQTSIDSDKMPKTKAVRGEMILQGSIVRETSDSSCSIVNIAFVDPKGSIPSSFVNKMKSKQHEVFAKIKAKIESS